MTWNDGPTRSKAYTEIAEILEDFISGTDYGNLYARLSADGVSDTVDRIMDTGNGILPQTLVKETADALRSGFELDYDDLVIEGGWMPRLPQMMARNYLLRHFLEIGNGLNIDGVRFSDATLNTAADDYTGFVDLIVVKIQTLGETSHYNFTEDDVKVVEQYLVAILALMHYCRDMLDMSSTLRPSLFQMRNRRMEGRIRGVIEMSTMGRDCPQLKELMSQVSDDVKDISNDRSLRDLQIARNERYKQTKMRLYKYTIRCSEDLNNQIEACDPYDFTHRDDLRKQLEQVQIFQRSFDKDR